MTEQERDPELLEEERLAKSLEHARLHGRNAYAATHQTPPKKFGTNSPQPATPTSPRGQASGDVSPRGVVRFVFLNIFYHWHFLLDDEISLLAVNS